MLFNLFIWDIIWDIYYMGLFIWDIYFIWILKIGILKYIEIRNLEIRMFFNLFIQYLKLNNNFKNLNFGLK